MENGNLSTLLKRQKESIDKGSISKVEFESSSSQRVLLLQKEAQLIYAETQVLTGFLSLMEESIAGLLRTAWCLHSALGAYQALDKHFGDNLFNTPPGPSLEDEFTIDPFSSEISNLPTTPESIEEENKANILGGMAFGIGSFNTVASMFPNVVLRLLSFVGLPCNRERGLQLLRMSLQGGRMRAPLSALLLLLMRVILPSFHSGDVADDSAEAEVILNVMLTRFPNSTLFTWLAGRLERMKGAPSKSIEMLTTCQALIGDDMVQLKHLCEYEIAWAYAFQFQWPKVLDIHRTLKVENNWSKSLYSYLEGVSLLQMGKVGAARKCMIQVLNQSSRKLGGKVIPPEQFAVRRAAEFLVSISLENCDEEDIAEETALRAELLKLMGRPESVTLPPIRLPTEVKPGSAAHAVVLAYPIPLPGLELNYMFGGVPQMLPTTLASAIDQIDAILDVIANGHVFNQLSPVWNVKKGEEPMIEGKGWTEIQSDDCENLPAPPSRPSKSKQEVFRLLNSAAFVPVKASSSQETPKSSLLGGMFKSVVSSVSTMATSALGRDSKPLPTVTPITPLTLVAVVAMCRGTICASAGLVDEALYCFEWIISQSTSDLKRELHTIGYAHYEKGLLCLDVARARLSQLREQPIDVHGGSIREKNLFTDGLTNILHSSLAKTIPDVKSASKLAKACFDLSTSNSTDFNWKFRLLARVHLAKGDLTARLRGSSVKRDHTTTSGSKQVEEEEFLSDNEEEDPSSLFVPSEEERALIESMTLKPSEGVDE